MKFEIDSHAKESDMYQSKSLEDMPKYHKVGMVDKCGEEIITVHDMRPAGMMIEITMDPRVRTIDHYTFISCIVCMKNGIAKSITPRFHAISITISARSKPYN